MYCKNCGGQIPDQAVVCVRCGVQTDAYYEQPRQSFSDGESPDRYCRNCGNEIPARAVVCVRCGVPTTAFYAQQAPARKNTSNRDQASQGASNSFYDAIDKWAWTLAATPFTVSLVLTYVLGGMIDGMVMWIILLAINSIIFFMDKRELERNGYKPEGWVWLGLILVPIYLFVRASRINGKYGYAITWCILFVLSLLL